MALVNSNFVTPGAVPYDAAAWTRAAQAPGVLFAPFTGESSAVDGKESFESGWGAAKFAFLGFFSDLSYAFFDFSANNPKEAEDFEDLWGAGPARIQTQAQAPFMLQPGQTLLLSVSGGSVQTITFVTSMFTNIASARAEEIAYAINRTLKGATADFQRERVQIMTDAVGTAARLAVVGGTAAALQFVFEPETVTFEGESTGTAEGAIFFRRVEFGLAGFEPDNAEVETFERFTDFALDGELDPDDALDRFLLEAADSFSTWEPFVEELGSPTLASAEVFAPVDWPDAEMTVIYT